MSRRASMDITVRGVGRDVSIPAGCTFTTLLGATFVTTKSYPRWWQKAWRLLPWVDKSRLTVRLHTIPPEDR